jgi:hypothetical protein
MASNAYAIFAARYRLGEAFAVHLQASCFLAMASLFLWLEFLHRLKRYVFNLPQLRSIFIFGGFREKIHIFTIFHHETDRRVLVEIEIRMGDLGSTIDMKKGFDKEELFRLKLHEDLEREFPNWYFNFIAV